MLIGSHLSIAGGLHRALETAHDYQFDCVAMFVRNQVRWKAPPLRDEAVEKFRSTRQQLAIGPVVAHASYLINLAGREEVRRKSITAMIEDVSRCARLGVDFLVFHPGSHEQTAEGIRLIADALNRIAADARLDDESTKILLETTAGQGNCIGHRFEQLAEILSQVDAPEQFGVCLDTCHIFAAGYDIRTPQTYAETMADFDRTVGLDRLLAIHLNDSRREFASRVDRHAHIGEGFIGREGLANIVRDPRLQAIPMILETPKGLDDQGRDCDKVNVATLRSLAR